MTWSDPGGPIGWGTLNVAGDRESKAPGIGDRVGRFLWAVFRQLGHRADG